MMNFAEALERELVDVLTSSDEDGEVGYAANEKERIRKAWHKFLEFDASAGKFKRQADWMTSSSQADVSVCDEQPLDGHCCHYRCQCLQLPMSSTA